MLDPIDVPAVGHTFETAHGTVLLVTSKWCSNGDIKAEWLTPDGTILNVQHKI